MVPIKIGDADIINVIRSHMSLVRYTNKKTGRVSIYESTSYYDPVLKQSRPKRKYIGYEDPVTGEFIPSSHKRGRQPNTIASGKTVPQEEYQKVAEALNVKNQRIVELNSQIKELNNEIRLLKSQIKATNSTIERCIETLKSASSKY